MDALETIHTRRSIRKFKDTKVPDELIEKILAAGMCAPSAGNEQPWHFVVIKDKNVLKEVPKFTPYTKMVKEVSLAILVCGDLSLEKHKGFWTFDCSAATQNILLAVHALGLGAVWTGVHPRDDRVIGFRKLLNIPSNVIPFAFIPIGYPREKSYRADRFKEDRVHYNKW